MKRSHSSIPLLLGTFTVLLLVVLYRAARDGHRTLSPQGCRMSWMYPSYIHQHQFKSPRSPPANPYSLWLYREGGWDAGQVSSTSFLNLAADHEM